MLVYFLLNSMKCILEDVHERLLDKLSLFTDGYILVMNLVGRRLKLGDSYKNPWP